MTVCVSLISLMLLQIPRVEQPVLVDPRLKPVAAQSVTVDSRQLPTDPRLATAATISTSAPSSIPVPSEVPPESKPAETLNKPEKAVPRPAPPPSTSFGALLNQAGE